MRRSSSLRKAIVALAMLAIFMVILRMSRPTTDNFPDASDLINEFQNSELSAAEELAKHAGAAKDLANDEHLKHKEGHGDHHDVPIKNHHEQIKEHDSGSKGSDNKGSIADTKAEGKVTDPDDKVVEKPKNNKLKDDKLKDDKLKDDKLKDDKLKDDKLKDDKLKDDKLKDTKLKDDTVVKGKAKDVKDGKSNAKDSSKDSEESEFDAEAAYKKIVESPDSPPVIIFSKSYCPHSMRAKNLLLEGHLIDPKPRVVELDIMDHGLELQAYLAELTGRRTVPNILVNGKSRGGASDLVEMGDDLVSNFLEWGNGKLTMSVQEPASA